MGGRKRGREISMCGCLSCAPYWGPGPQPRHVPWPGIEPATFWFSGQHPTHWTTPVKVLYFETFRENLSTSFVTNVSGFWFCCPHAFMWRFWEIQNHAVDSTAISPEFLYWRVLWEISSVFLVMLRRSGWVGTGVPEAKGHWGWEPHPTSFSKLITGRNEW